MPLIIEDEGKLLGKKQAKVPDKLVNKIKKNLNLFGQYKKSKGFKRASSIVDDDYNKRSNKKDKINNGDKTLSFSDIKKIDHEFKKMSVNDDDVNAKNLGFILPGGNDMKNWAHDTLRKMRTAVKKVPLVPQVTKLEKNPTKPNDVNKNVKMGTASVKLTESIDYFYENYYDEYGASYVFNSFLKHPNGKQDWGVLINPEMYAKALREFTRFGKLTSFPSKYVYQWIGIIMKNTAILNANTDICGHSEHFPVYECQEFLEDYYKDGRYIKVEDYSKITIEVFPEEIIEMCNNNDLIDEVVDKYGQTYFPFVTQKDADEIAEKQKERKNIKKIEQKYGNILKYVELYNDKYDSEYGNNKLIIDYKTNKFYWIVESDEILYKIGITGEWMSLPDGSDGISDYGIEPIFKILSEYDENLPPEKVLVIINKVLDIYHCRGDLSSIFIQGGAKALSAISEEIKRHKKIIVNENQLLQLKEYHDQQVFNFDKNGEAYFEKNNWEHYVDFLEKIGTYGTLPQSKWGKREIHNAIESAKNEIDPNQDEIGEDEFRDFFSYFVYYVFTNRKNEIEDLFEKQFLEFFKNYEDFKKSINYYYSDEITIMRKFIEEETNAFDTTENIYAYMTHLGNQEFEKELKEYFANQIYEYDIEKNMTINERGLVYVERNITIPKFNSPYFNLNGHKNYYRYLNELYSDLGYCFSWGKNKGEAYCGNGFGVNGSSEIKLKCWVDPEDINWEETVYKNCYSLREEQEIFINKTGAKIEVFDVVLEYGYDNNNINVSGKSLLKKPIIIEY